MANLTSQDNDSLGNDTQNNDLLSNDTQNDPPTAVDPPQGQDPVSNLERYFADLYPFQTSVMSNLNRLDFKNLQLAGVKADISQEVQKKYLIPSKCDETLTSTASGPVICSNTTETVNEIKACYGMHWDGIDRGIRPHQPNSWIEPNRHRHIRECNSLMELSNGKEGGNFDSFNICIHCHDRYRQSRVEILDFAISQFHSPLCRDHCEKFVEQRPYNSCHCRTFLEKYWRCNACSFKTFDGLRFRVSAFRRSWNANQPSTSSKIRCIGHRNVAFRAARTNPGIAHRPKSGCGYAVPAPPFFHPPIDMLRNDLVLPPPCLTF